MHGVVVVQVTLPAIHNSRYSSNGSHTECLVLAQVHCHSSEINCVMKHQQMVTKAVRE